MLPSSTRVGRILNLQVVVRMRPRRRPLPRVASQELRRASQTASNWMLRGALKAGRTLHDIFVTFSAAWDSQTARLALSSVADTCTDVATRRVLDTREPG